MIPERMQLVQYRDAFLRMHEMHIDGSSYIETNNHDDGTLLVSDRLQELIEIAHDANEMDLNRIPLADFLVNLNSKMQELEEAHVTRVQVSLRNNRGLTRGYQCADQIDLCSRSCR